MASAKNPKKKKVNESGLLATLKKNDQISFDLIKNAKGEDHYKDDFVSIDLENIEREAKSGYYDGVEISIYDGTSIEDFDTISSDKSLWEFELPIIKVHLQGVNFEQFQNIISSIVKEIKELSVILDSDGFDTSPLLIACPALERLNIESWSELDIKLGNIESMHLTSLRLSTPSLTEKKIDLSKSTIEELIWDARIGQLNFPVNVNSIELGSRIADAKLNWDRLIKVDSLKIAITDESSDSLDFFKKMGSLKILELSISGFPVKGKPKIELPSGLQSLKLNSSSQDMISIDLGCLENCPALKNLILITDVGNGGNGFLNYKALSCLSSIESIEIAESSMGVNGYKSHFDVKALNSLKSLKKLILKGIGNINDLSDFKGLDNLQSLTLNESRILSLKGVSNLENLGILELMDCHAISDFSFLSNTKLQVFVFRISSFWGTEVALKKENIMELKDSGIDQIDFDMNDWRFFKKDYTAFGKKYEVDTDDSCLSLKLKG